MSDEPIKRRPGRPRKDATIAAEDMRDGRRNVAEQGAEAAPVAQIEAMSADPAPVNAVGLAEFIAALEGRRIAEGIVLVHVSHPDATGELFQSKFSGVRTSQGPIRAMWSDGTTTDA